MASRRRYTQTRYPGRDDDGTTAAALLADIIDGQVQASAVFINTQQLGEREVTVTKEGAEGQTVRETVRIPVTKITTVEYDERAPRPGESGVGPRQ